MPPLIA
jgi:hypothetical protein